MQVVGDVSVVLVVLVVGTPKKLQSRMEVAGTAEAELMEPLALVGGFAGDVVIVAESVQAVAGVDGIDIGKDFVVGSAVDVGAAAIVPVAL